MADQTMEIWLGVWYPRCEDKEAALIRGQRSALSFCTFVIWGNRPGEWSIPPVLFLAEIAPVVLLVPYPCAHHG
jgi:hypothetical protein